VRLDRVEPSGTYLMLDLAEWLGSVPGRASMGARHRTLLASDGHLFLDPRDLPGSTAMNWLTGEAINVASLRQIGDLPLANGKAIRNDCYELELCSVQYDNGAAVPSPLAGVLRCIKDQRGDDGFLLEAEGLSLRLGAGGGYDFDGGECDRAVAVGDALPRAEYLSIRAFAGDGSPLSLVVTHDGKLYVGTVRLHLACPCEPRS
jgi:hypothetical protein